MRKLTIYKRLFYNADCYTKGTKQTNSGVQVHSTGANNPWLKRYVQPDDGRIGKNVNNNSHNRPGGNVCASAYIGKQSDGTVAVYQALPWNNRCWLSGSGANGNANRKGFAGFEICEDNKKDESYFRAAVMGAAVDLTAYLCGLFGVGVDRVFDHKELHDLGLASNHGDITHWLRLYGLTMDDFRAEVKKAMDEGVEAVYVDCDDGSAASEGTQQTIRRGDSGEAVEQLQGALVTLGYNLGAYGPNGDGIDGKFGAATEKAVKDFQRENGLTVDGICGPKTHAAIAAALVDKPPDETEKKYRIVIPSVDAATAAYLLETYPGAYSEDVR